MIGSLVTFVALEVRRSRQGSRDEPFSDTWLAEASKPIEHLYVGEPTFDWGDDEGPSSRKTRLTLRRARQLVTTTLMFH